MTARTDALSLMNDLGARGVPFLFIIDFEMEQPVVLPLNEIDSSEILYDINGRTNCTETGKGIRSRLIHKYPVPYETYLKAFNAVQRHLEEGDSYLVNLTFPTPIETDSELRDTFFSSHAKYRLFFRDTFVVFSPEIFVRIDNGIISSFPMKGTIDASIPDAEKIILADEKENAEHVTIVDLIRNDLSITATDVHVERFRYIDRIRTQERDLLQVSSKITGRLPATYPSEIGTILFSLLPAGSVTGAPKKRTMEIIREVEAYGRGYYTGVFGYFDGLTLNSGVMIRFIQKSMDGFIYKSGGGITVYSNCRKEYQEMIDKVYVPSL